MSKLLIIDDERGIRNTLREILADEGYEVDVAENGKQGLEMAQEKAYDLIFSDIKMPEMDGMELLAKIGELRLEMEDLRSEISYLCAPYGQAHRDNARTSTPAR